MRFVGGHPARVAAQIVEVSDFHIGVGSVDIAAGILTEAYKLVNLLRADVLFGTSVRSVAGSRAFGRAKNGKRAH